MDLDTPPQHPSAPEPRYFFQGESLARGIEAAIARHDPWLIPRKGKDGAEWRSVRGEAISENTYAIEVALEFHSASKRNDRCRLVVARNDKELALLVKTEARNLSTLAPRLKESIPTPLSSGTLFLPDSQRRAGQNRRIFAYITRPLPTCVFAGIGRSGQMVGYSDTVRLLSLNATNAVRAKVFQWCLRSYDASARTAMPPPDLQRGTLRLAFRSASAVDPVIAGCPYLWDHLDPVALLHRLTGFDWTDGERLLPLLPADHDILLDAMLHVLGRPTARDWAQQYAHALEKGRYKPHHRFSIEDLARLRESLGV